MGCRKSIIRLSIPRAAAGIGGKCYISTQENEQKVVGSSTTFLKVVQKEELESYVVSRICHAVACGAIF